MATDSTRWAVALPATDWVRDALRAGNPSQLLADWTTLLDPVALLIEQARRHSGDPQWFHAGFVDVVAPAVRLLREASSKHALARDLAASPTRLVAAMADGNEATGWALRPQALPLLVGLACLASLDAAQTQSACRMAAAASRRARGAQPGHDVADASAGRAEWPEDDDSAPRRRKTSAAKS